MDEIIVEYVYPVLFVLRDRRGARYLCVCYSTRGAQRWIIAPVSVKSLIGLLKNQVLLAEPFLKQGTKKVLAERDYEQSTENFRVVDEVPAEYAPAEGEYLDAEEHEWDEYIKRLRKEYVQESTADDQVSEKVGNLYRIASTQYQALTEWNTVAQPKTFGYVFVLPEKSVPFQKNRFAWNAVTWDKDFAKGGVGGVKWKKLYRAQRSVEVSYAELYKHEWKSPVYSQVYASATD